MEYFILIIVALFLWKIYSALNYESGEIEQGRNERRDEVSRLLILANKSLKRVGNLATARAQVNAYSKTLGYLEEANNYTERKDIMPDETYMLTVLELERKVKVSPAVDYIGKAIKFRYHGNESAAKKALLDAMFEIDTLKITDDDFRGANIQPVGYDGIVTVTDVLNSLKELGWEPK